MVKRFWIILFICSSIGSTPLVCAASTGQKVYNSASISIFTVFAPKENSKGKSPLGSAVAITDHLLATACHLALSTNYLMVEVNNKSSLGKLFYQNQKKDLCIFEVADSDLSAVNIRPSDTVQIGEEVYAIGNPEGLEKTISRGIISNKEIKDGVISKLQTDAAISPGSSGGGLFDQDGNLIGIISSDVPDGVNIGFAIPTEFILEGIQEKNKELVAAEEWQ